MKVYSRGDIWDMGAMERFVHDVRSVDPKATGNPLQTFEASRQMKRSYEQAALYALVAIFVLLYIDFRSVRHTLLAMIPVGLGMILLFGMMGWLGEPLNPANMIVLPLILGIGVDDGVHVVHDYLRRRGGYRVSASTASAVLITSLTTMVGFGSLMIADHRGLQSLGRVLTIGGDMLPVYVPDCVARGPYLENAGAGGGRRAVGRAGSTREVASARSCPWRMGSRTVDGSSSLRLFSLVRATRLHRAWGPR